MHMVYVRSFTPLKCNNIAWQTIDKDNGWVQRSGRAPPATGIRRLSFLKWCWNHLKCLIMTSQWLYIKPPADSLHTHCWRRSPATICMKFILFACSRASSSCHAPQWHVTGGAELEWKPMCKLRALLFSLALSSPQQASAAAPAGLCVGRVMCMFHPYSLISVSLQSRRSNVNYSFIHILPIGRRWIHAQGEHGNIERHIERSQTRHQRIYDVPKVVVNPIY